MPDFPIIDSHVHLWNPKKFRIRWIDGDLVLNKRLDLDVYAQHTSGVQIEAMVYAEVNVAPHYCLLEAMSVDERAKIDPRIKGLFAHAPLEDGEPARTYLSALKSIGSRVKGVRRLIQGESDPGFCLRPDFLVGVQMLPQFDFSFDICVKHWQLPQVVEMVRRCPQVSFILDHIGKPDIKSRLLDPWQAHIQELAAMPNVVCKISGMVTEADQANWRVDDLRPYFDHVVECFGEDRVMFGSDWSVVLLASSYTRWVETVEELSLDMNESAKRKLWADNARRFYRLA
jgi:L-fuconolactonase